MNVLEEMWAKALGTYGPRGNRRAVRSRIEGNPNRKTRSTRRCDVCDRVTPTYRLVRPEGRNVQMCLSCRASELDGAVR